MPGGPVGTVAELDAEFWREGMTMFVHHRCRRGLAWSTSGATGRCVTRCVRSGCGTIATAHSPLITEGSIDDAFAILASLAGATPPPVPDQSVLDAIVGAPTEPVTA